MWQSFNCKKWTWERSGFMKQKRSILKSGVLILFALIAIALIATTAIAADSKFGSIDNRVCRITKPQTKYFILSNAKGQCVKGSLQVLSGKRYATVKIKKRNNKWNIQVAPKKPGTVKFSFKYNEGGKITSHTLRIKIVKYVCPVSKITFGSKHLEKKFKNHFFSSIKGKVKTGKITVTLKKGWKLESIYLFDGDNSKQFENGSKITMKRGNILCMIFSKNGRTTDLNLKMF